MQVSLSSSKTIVGRKFFYWPRSETFDGFSRVRSTSLSLNLMQFPNTSVTFDLKARCGRFSGIYWSESGPRTMSALIPVLADGKRYSFLATLFELNCFSCPFPCSLVLLNLKEKFPPLCQFKISSCATS